MNLKFIYFIFLFIVISCDFKDEYFNEQLMKVENELPYEKLAIFTKSNERQALFICLNDSDFKNKIKNSIELKKYFLTKNINDFEDVLIIFYTSLHRKLNNKVIDLDKQIKETLEIRNTILKCNEFQKNNYTRNNKFIINDTIKIRIKMNNLGLIDYPMECEDLQWIFNDNNDMIILGKINKKYYFKSTPNKTFMSVKIIDLNKTSSEIPKIGKDFNFDISYLIIEPDGADMSIK